jgi:hypothetical protein
MPAPSTIFLAGAVRIAAAAAVQNAINAGIITATLYSPGDWNTPPEAMPAILLRSGLQKKRSTVKAVTAFDSQVAIEIQAQLQAETAEAAQTAIELMGAGIEQALYTDTGLLGAGAVGLLERIAQVDAEIKITGAGKEHTAELHMRIWCQAYEEFLPSDGIPLTEIQVTATDQNTGDVLAAADLTSLQT